MIQTLSAKDFFELIKQYKYALFFSAESGNNLLHVRVPTDKFKMRTVPAGTFIEAEHKTKNYASPDYGVVFCGNAYQFKMISNESQSLSISFRNENMECDVRLDLKIKKPL